MAGLEPTGTPVLCLRPETSRTGVAALWSS